MPESPRSRPAPHGKMVIFYAAAAPSLEESGLVCERSFIEGGSLEDLFDERMVGESRSDVPFRQEGADGFSLVTVEFPPGFMLPRHSHSADCLYYIVAGGIALGQRQLGPGDGFFVPAEQPYAYRAGPQGVKLLEFRHRASFDTKFHEKDLSRFRDRAHASMAAAAAAAAQGET